MQFLDQNVELESRSPIKASKIPCLLFTDDNLAFCRTNFEACRELSTVLCDFYQIRDNSLMHQLMINKWSHLFLTLHNRTISENILDVQFSKDDRKQKLFQN